jgi:O-antigen/teichoic acid export membrane protein
MEQDIKSKFFSGLSWVFIQNVLLKGLGMVFSVILARILSPEDFGLVGMLTVFISLSQVFIESGITEALIQKPDCSDRDYSTAFFFNIVVSLTVYALLFLGAPLIATFYHTPELCLLTKILCINVVLGSLIIVQRAKMTRAMEFRPLTFISLTSLIISSVVGLVMAYKGWGVWSLVVQTLLYTCVSVVMFPLFSHWFPKWIFDKNSFMKLWNYGSRLIVTGVLNVVILNLSSILVGRYYKSRQVGFYTRAQSLAEVPAGLLTTVLSSVSFPMFCKIQDNRDYQLKVYKRILFNAVLIVGPIAVLLTLLAKPLVLVLLTEKWLPCVTIMQFLLLGRMLMPIGATNTNLLRSVGNTSLYMKLYFIEAPLTILGIIIAVPFGVEAMAFSTLLVTLIMFLLSSQIIGGMFGYGLLKMIADWRMIFLSLLLMALGLYGILIVISNEYLQLIVGGLVGAAIYLICCKCFHLLDDEIVEQIRKRMPKFI